MKILHITDLHFNKQWFSWIESSQNDFDIFCITGDFLEKHKEESLKEQIIWISNWMKNFKKPLFVCSGNHDLDELENQNWLDKISNIYGDNSKKTINGIKIGCISYEKANFNKFNDCDIVLYHLPPANTKTSVYKPLNEDWGDEKLFQMLKDEVFAPKMILCGHVHKPIKTRENINGVIVSNPGKNNAKEIPNHYIIEDF